MFSSFLLFLPSQFLLEMDALKETLVAAQHTAADLTAASIRQERSLHEERARVAQSEAEVSRTLHSVPPPDLYLDVFAALKDLHPVYFTVKSHSANRMTYFMRIPSVCIIPNTCESFSFSSHLLPSHTHNPPQPALSPAV